MSEIYPHVPRSLKSNGSPKARRTRVCLKSEAAQYTVRAQVPKLAHDLKDACVSLKLRLGAEAPLRVMTAGAWPPLQGQN